MNDTTEEDGYETVHPQLGGASRFEIVQRLVALEASVEELEARLPAPEVRTMAAPSATYDGRIVIGAHQLERLERIEQAARVVVARLSQPFQADQPEALRLLEEALRR